MGLIGRSFLDPDEEPFAWVWAMTSLKDPRWNGNGRVTAWSASCGWPPKAKDWYAECQRILGSPPEDLWFTCVKA